MTMRSIQLTILAVLLIPMSAQAVLLYSQEGHIATHLEMEVFNFATRDEDGYISSPVDGYALTTQVDFENNTTPPIAPGSQTSFGDATLTAQYGRITGVSNWWGLQPQPHWGLNGVVSGIYSSAAFTIPDITIDYRGVEEDETPAPGQTQVGASLHVSTDISGWGRHVIDIIADFTGDIGGTSLKDKRVLDLTDGAISVSDMVTSFGGYTLPVGDAFDLHLQVDVQSFSLSYGLNIDEVGIKHRSFVNWSVELGGSPALILPPGYFANSADGSIVDNYFVGTQSGNPATQVPAPAPYLLLLTGLLAAFIRRYLEQ